MVGNLAVALIGVWKLISFEIEDPNLIRKPWGKDPHGTLIYTADGHMSVAINDARPDLFAQSGVGQVEPKEIFESILFYSGTYRVERDEVKHIVTEASDPRRLGKTLSRNVELVNGVLTLTSPSESFGRAILTWKMASEKGR